jgi:hypothetical protein
VCGAEDRDQEQGWEATEGEDEVRGSDVSILGRGSAGRGLCSQAQGDQECDPIWVKSMFKHYPRFSLGSNITADFLKFPIITVCIFQVFYN